jgi:serine/threonine protein kinase
VWSGCGSAWAKDSSSLSERACGSACGSACGKESSGLGLSESVYAALKVIPKAKVLSSTNKNHVLNERRLLLRLRHPNIVRLFKAFHDSQHVFFLTELCHGGELFNRLLAAPNGRLSASADALFYAGCVVLALEKLGEMEIAYRDLKPENLLIDQRGYCKLAGTRHAPLRSTTRARGTAQRHSTRTAWQRTARTARWASGAASPSSTPLRPAAHDPATFRDRPSFHGPPSSLPPQLVPRRLARPATDFGFARELRAESGERAKTLCGTPEYMAPEMIRHRTGYTTSVDWWAFGVLVFEMIGGRSPFCAKAPMQVYRNILEMNPPPPLPAPTAPNGGPPSAAEIASHAAANRCIRSLLTHRPTQRLGNLDGGAADVKAHEWFADLDWDALAAGQIAPPWIPELSGPADTRYFAECSAERPVLNILTAARRGEGSCAAALGGAGDAAAQAAPAAAPSVAGAEDHFASFGPMVEEISS